MKIIYTISIDLECINNMNNIFVNNYNYSESNKKNLPRKKAVLKNMYAKSIDNCVNDLDSNI